MADLTHNVQVFLGCEVLPGKRKKKKRVNSVNQNKHFEKLSGRVLDLGLKGLKSKTHPRHWHCVVSLIKTF